MQLFTEPLTTEIADITHHIHLSIILLQCIQNHKKDNRKSKDIIRSNKQISSLTFYNASCKILYASVNHSQNHIVPPIMMS